MDLEQREFVRKLYYNPRGPSSYSDLDGLYRVIKARGRNDIKRKDLLEFMRGEEVYTSHVGKQKLRNYAKIVSPFPNYGLEIDSAYMMFPGKNRKKYMIIAVDIFSRKAAARAVPNLKANTVNDAVIAIIGELGGNYVQVRTDRGSDYYNAKVAATFRENNMRHIPAFEPIKTAHAENLIQIIKRKLYKVMQYKFDHNWSKYLQDVMYSYNHTKSKSLGGVSPVEVTGDRIQKVWFSRAHKDLRKQLQYKPFKFEIGDNVRIHYSRGNSFKKEYNEKMGAQVYSIHQRYSPGNNHLYKVKNDQGELLPGKFRENELELVNINNDTIWRIEKVLARRVKNGIREVKVRWLDYDAFYDSWIPAKDIHNSKSHR